MKKLSETLKELGIAFDFPIVIEDANGNRAYCETSDGCKGGTPRTDEIRHNVADLAMFARKLERELNEATKLAENRLTAIKSGIKVTGRYKRELAEAKAALAQAHKDFGHELRDPCGTIWEECDRLQKDLDHANDEWASWKHEAELRGKALAEALKDTERLDWVEANLLSLFGMADGTWEMNDRTFMTARESIDAAMEADK